MWEGGTPLPRQEPQQFDHQNGAFWWILNCKSVVNLSIIDCFVLSIAEVLVLQKLKNPARYKCSTIHMFILHIPVCSGSPYAVYTPLFKCSSSLLLARLFVGQCL